MKQTDPAKSKLSAEPPSPCQTQTSSTSVLLLPTQPTRLALNSLLALQKAIEIVQKAIDADVKQEYEEAYKQFVLLPVALTHSEDADVGVCVVLKQVSEQLGLLHDGSEFDRRLKTRPTSLASRVSMCMVGEDKRTATNEPADEDHMLLLLVGCLQMKCPFPLPLDPS